MRLIIIAALILPSLWAQPYPDGATLNRQAETAIERLHSLQYKEDVTTTTTIGGQEMKTTAETSRAMLNPGHTETADGANGTDGAKMRFETHGQALTMIIVSDGETTWTYSSINNEYTRRSVAFGPQGLIDAMGIGGMMPRIADVPLTQKTTGEDSVTIDGQKHDCWVVHTDIGPIELPAAAKGVKMTGGAMTSWIDKKLGLDLQTDVSMKVSMPGGISAEARVKTVKKNLQIDAPLDESVFKFNPPEGAKETEKLSLIGAIAMGKTPGLVGKAAPDFTVQTVDGKPYSLAALKGKPTLLDFWATWCGPCRKAMPSVEKVAQDFKAQGLVVLGVDAGEGRDTVQAFLKKTPMAYPAVLSGNSTILKDYHISAYPTFVLIGSDGKIAAYETGFGGEAELRAMLEEAGLSKK